MRTLSASLNNFQRDDVRVFPTVMLRTNSIPLATVVIQTLKAARPEIPWRLFNGDQIEVTAPTLSAENDNVCRALVEGILVGWQARGARDNAR